MKNIFLLFVLSLSLLACNQDIKDENLKLKEENEQLKAERNYQDTTINEFVDAFEQVQQNLAEIRMREKSIREAQGSGIENSEEVKEQIMADIKAINELLEENKNTITKLTEQTKNQSGRLYNFKKLVANLKSQLASKDTQIVRLKEYLANANFKMEQLNAKVGMLTEEKMMQRETIENQQEEINTAYYAVGTSKELEANGVIDKEGGFIGIGRTKTLADNLNKEYFTKINRANTKRIPLDIGNKDIRVVSPHPTASYSIKKDDDKVTAIEIANPNEFWKSTKFLVLLID